MSDTQEKPKEQSIAALPAEPQAKTMNETTQPASPTNESPKLSERHPPLAKMKKRWKALKEIKAEAYNDMIKQMASANYKSVGCYTRIKISRMLEQLNKKEINLDQIRILCFSGLVEDCRGLRSTVWKLILYHLPLDATQWVTKMQEKFDEYQKLREEYIPGLIPNNLTKETASLWEDIEKDIKRTRPDVAFFTQAVDKSISIKPEVLYELTQNRKADLTPEQKKEYVMTHGDVLGRLLYIYGRRHPDVNYVQGMNELLAVIYYLFAKDCFQGNEKYVESDSYFCFENLMEELKDWFNSSKDKEPTGIRAKLKHLAEVIEKNKPNIWEVIKEHGVDINIFAIRWQMLLLCQDFLMPDVTRLWDSLLSDMARFNFFSYICLALIVNVEEQILNGEFDTIVKSINDSPSNIEVKDLIHIAQDLLAKDVESSP